MERKQRRGGYSGWRERSTDEDIADGEKPRC